MDTLVFASLMGLYYWLPDYALATPSQPCCYNPS